MRQKQLLTKLMLLVAIVLMGAGTAWAEDKTDVLDIDFTGVSTGSGYSTWTGKTGTSGAVYAGNSAGGNSAIQLRSNNSNSGVVTTKSGGTVKKVVVTWNSNTTSGRTLNVYGKNSAYSQATDLYNASNQGTLLGTIVCGTSTELTIDGSYTFIGFRSASGAMYLDKVDITWEASSAVATTTAIDASGINNTDVHLGTAAGTLTATVTAGGTAVSGATVSWSGNNDEVATIDAATGAVTLVSAGTVTFTATYAGVEDQYQSSSATYTMTVTDSTPFTGGDVTFEAGKDGDENELTISKNGVTLTLEGGSNLSGPGKFTDTDYRIYSGATLTISTSQGTITKIVFTDADKPCSNLSTTTGSFSDNTWTGSATSVVFTASAQARASKIVVTVEYDDRTEIATIGELSPTTVNIGDIDDFTLAITPAVSTLVEGTDYIVVWETSDESILELADETYEAKAKGTVDVTVTVTPDDDVTYSEVSKTFKVRVVDPNANDGLSEAKAFTCAEAIEAINDGVDATTDYYVKGIVNTVDAFNSDKSLTYWIADNGNSKQFEVYKGFGINGAEFTSKDDLQAGDIVVVKGKLTKYNSTYELNSGSQLVSLVRPVVASITVEKTSLTGFTYEEGNGPSTAQSFTVSGVNLTENIALTLNANSSFEMSNAEDGTYTSSLTLAPTSGSVDETTVFVRLKADLEVGNYEGTVTITSAGATNVIVNISGSVTAPIVPTYATLPFTFDSGKADIEGTDGLYQEGLGSDYNGSPKLKFDGTGDYLLLQFSERPGTLSFDIKGNSFSGGTFKVQTSEDGLTYTDLETYTELNTTQSESFNNLGEDVRYIKWIYTSKVSGNVALGNIELNAYGATPTPISYTLSWTAGANTELFVFDANDTSNQLTNGSVIAAGTTIQVSVDVEQGYEIESLVVDGNDVTNQIDQTGLYEFEMPEHDVFITSSAAAISVTPANVASVTFDFTDTDWGFPADYETSEASYTNDGYTFIFGASSNGHKKMVSSGTQTGVIMGKQDATLTFPAFPFNVSKIVINGISGASGKVTQNIFVGDEAVSTETTGATGANTYEIAADKQDAGTVYVLTITNGNNTQISSIEIYGYENKTISAAGYATYCSDKALDYSAVAGLTAYKATVANKQVSFTEVTEVPANAGVLLKGAEGTYKIPVIASAAALEGNAFVGVLNDTEVAAGSFVLLNGNSGVGFYKTTKAFTVGAHTAYLPASVGGARSFIGFDGETTGVNAVNGEGFMVNGPVYDLQGRRVAQPQKGLYIVNGRKVVIK